MNLASMSWLQTAGLVVALVSWSVAAWSMAQLPFHRFPWISPVAEEKRTGVAFGTLLTLRPDMLTPKGQIYRKRLIAAVIVFFADLVLLFFVPWAQLFGA